MNNVTLALGHNLYINILQFMPVSPTLRKQGQNKDGSSLVYKVSNDSGTHSDHLLGVKGIQGSRMAILSSRRSSLNPVEEI